ncbi:MAG: retroviral-like aspartic protease family protein [Candidatus Aenigmarchaeota archaeon]|nr:retroviral-like aspartic protease family protein [Candidatus Aenigmarchaeota archaeon]
MEIVKKAKISVNGKYEEVEAVIDTGAERTMINEEVLLRIGAPHLDNLLIEAAGEYADTKPVYGASVEIDGYKFTLLITGGKKNLIGHDFLQLAKAVIDENTGIVKFTKNYINY